MKAGTVRYFHDEQQGTTLLCASSPSTRVQIFPKFDSHTSSQQQSKTAANSCKQMPAIDVSTVPPLFLKKQPNKSDPQHTHGLSQSTRANTHAPHPIPKPPSQTAAPPEEQEGGLPPVNMMIDESWHARIRSRFHLVDERDRPVWRWCGGHVHAANGRWL